MKMKIAFVFDLTGGTFLGLIENEFHFLWTNYEYE